MPNDCPLPNAQTRILDRRQTESDIQRNFYIVEVVHEPPLRIPGLNGNDDFADNKEIVEVDLSCILQYVSPRHLEDFENEQFQIEAAAEAEVLRQEAEELARRRLEKNARILGRGRGSRMLSGLGLDPNAPRRGRPRGGGKEQGRGSWRGRASLIRSLEMGPQRDLTGHGGVETLSSEENYMQRYIAETEEDDSGDEMPIQTSPGIMRSAFVANSALTIPPISPTQRHSKRSFFHGELAGVSDTDSSDSIIEDSDTARISGAAMQLRLEDVSEDQMVDSSDMEGSSRHGHRNKRRKTESTTSKSPARREPNQISRHPNSHLSHALEDSSHSASDDELGYLEPSGRSIAPAAQSGRIHASDHSAHHLIDSDKIDVQQNYTSPLPDQEEDEAEEYVVEAILEHFYDDGKKYYLIKWAGYEDSHDWLPEEDLEGAAELVEEYKERVKRKKMKGKDRMK